MEENFSIKKAVLIATGAVVLITGLSCFGQVGAGHRGVMMTFGAVDDKVIEEGLYFKKPFIQKIKKIDVRLRKLESEASAASQDLQDVTTQVALNYHINPAQAAKLYQQVGNEYEASVISPALQEVVKSVMAKYTAEQLVTKREEVRNKIIELIKSKIEPTGIVVDAVNIINFNFSQSFNAAIEAKVTAEQNALAAKNKLSQIKFEADQKIESARGDAESVKLNAIARAEAIKIEGKALSENQNVVALREQEKWLGLCPLRDGVTCVFDKEGMQLILNKK